MDDPAESAANDESIEIDIIDSHVMMMTMEQQPQPQPQQLEEGRRALSSIAVAPSDEFVRLAGTTTTRTSAAASPTGKKEEGDAVLLEEEQDDAVVAKTPSEETADNDGDGDGDDDSSSSIHQPPKQSPSSSSSSGCRHHPRVREMHTTADWWSLWIGLATFALAVGIVFGVLAADPTKAAAAVVPLPQPWSGHPLDAWDAYSAAGVPLLLLALGGFYGLALHGMGKLQSQQQQPQDEEDEDSDTTTAVIMVTDPTKIKNYARGFALMALLATISLWLGSNEWAARQGLGYAVVAIVIGMALANVPFTARRILPWLAPAAKDGEFFIKCSLTLLAVRLDALAKVGAPGMLVAWIGSPVAVISGYTLGVRLFGCGDALALIVAVGAAWCGASAISAVAPVVGATSEDVALAVSVVALFTIFFTFAQPYAALAVGMPDDVAGAWIGGSVDQTGNVIVSAAIISDEATEVAGIVKMVLNAALGIMASVIACYWNSRKVAGDDGKKEFKWIMLWDKFPKFTLGFIITSAILTGIMQRVGDDSPEGQALPKAISAMNKWWFAIAFVGIGLTTNIKKLWEKAWHSGIIQVYLLANTIDIILALGLSYLAYGYLVD